MPGFHARVIVTMAFPAHMALHPILFEAGLVRGRGLWTPPIRMMDGPRTVGVGPGRPDPPGKIPSASQQTVSLVTRFAARSLQHSGPLQPLPGVLLLPSASLSPDVP